MGVDGRGCQYVSSLEEEKRGWGKGRTAMHQLGHFGSERLLSNVGPWVSL